MNQPRSLLIALLFALAVCATPFTALLDTLPSTDSAETPPLGMFVYFFLLGVTLMACYWHPYRSLGFVIPAASTWVVSLLIDHWWNLTSGVVTGLASGITLMALGRYASRYRSSGWIVGGFVGLGVAFAFLQSSRSPKYELQQFSLFASILVGSLTLLAWFRLFRPFFELLVEPPLWWMFRIRGAGPELQDFPMKGPCLVIANHACWVDPIILAKLLPRALTSMMAGRFYDLPVISWLMRRFGIIKVYEQTIRREIPELNEAIAALDRGECLVMFPEGYLRRREDRPLKRFGRGVWEILKARPDTPVYACWIEGAWGSYTSYFNGKPTKNKKRDFRRPIGVGVSKAEVLPADVLEHHLRTRIHLMNSVIASRDLLGLPPMPAFELPARDEDEAEGDQS